jgi:hypothetical protein
MHPHKSVAKNAGGAEGDALGFDRRWAVSELHLFLPEEFAPHWLRSPRRSNFLDRVALISTAEARARPARARCRSQPGLRLRPPAGA